MNSGFHNWADIRVFLAVCRQGSTLAASKALGIAQPTVARRIDALEHALKLTLFDRDTRGFHPTPDAIQLLPTAEAVEASLLVFEKAVEDTRRARLHPIRITAPRVNFSSNFSAILSDFCEAHPGTSFELISSYKFLDLIAGEADVAIRFGKTIEDERLICRKLTTVTSSLYVSQDYARRHGFPESEAEFDGHVFVVEDPPRRASQIDTWLRKRIDEKQIISRCNGVETVLAAVKAGLGVGPLPTSMARGESLLIRCFEPPAGTDIYSWLAISPEAYRRPEVKAFSAFFAPRFQAIFKGAAAKA